MDSDRIRFAIEKALSDCVQGIQLHGIVDACVKSAAIPSEQLQQVAAELAQHGHTEIGLWAEVELFLRVSNTELLTSIERAAFRVRVNADGNQLSAAACNKQDWRTAWERGIEPIRQAALQGMRRDVWNVDETLAEDSYTFQAAMVLLASELVGPYFDRIATFVEYPPGFVQVIAARLHEANIWDGGEVRCEDWFDPQKGGLAFLLDLMVAEGKLIRRWSEEKEQYAYHKTEIGPGSHFAV